MSPSDPSGTDFGYQGRSKLRLRSVVQLPLMTLTSLIWHLHPCSCPPLAWELHLSPCPGPYLACTCSDLLSFTSLVTSELCWNYRFLWGLLDEKDPIMGPTLPFLFRCSGIVPLFRGSYLNLLYCLASTSPSFLEGRCPSLFASWQGVFQVLEIGEYNPQLNRRNKCSHGMSEQKIKSFWSSPAATTAGWPSRM